MTKDTKIGISIVAIIGFCWIINLVWKDTSEISSPVEEIHHNEIVNFVDSVINARFNDIDIPVDDDISIPHDSLGRVLVPKEE